MIPSYAHCEPLLMSDPDYANLVNIVQKQYPRACIQMIDRYRNPVLEGLFEEKKQQLAAKGWGQEYQVFHGTRREHVASICEHGFQPNRASRMAFGVGIYFSKTFALSWSYTDTIKGFSDDPLSYIFVCRILPGNTCHGTADTPPTRGFDSSCNSTTAENACIFAIPEADQMIPHYLIRFHKESESTYTTPVNETSLKDLAIEKMSLKELEQMNNRMLKRIPKKKTKKNLPLH